MVLPLGVVVRVLRERRVVERLPLAWRTAVRPSRMRRRARRGGPSVARPPSGGPNAVCVSHSAASRRIRVAARIQRRVGLSGIGRRSERPKWEAARCQVLESEAVQLRILRQLWAEQAKRCAVATRRAVLQRTRRRRNAACGVC